MDSYCHYRIAVLFILAMPRAAVQPISVDNTSRPLYPRTQFSSHNYGGAPRVHVGDTSQPISGMSYIWNMSKFLRLNMHRLLKSLNH